MDVLKGKCSCIGATPGRGGRGGVRWGVEGPARPYKAAAELVEHILPPTAAR